MEGKGEVEGKGEEEEESYECTKCDEEHEPDEKLFEKHKKYKEKEGAD